MAINFQKPVKFNADEALAQITRDDFANFEEVFAPLEKQVLDIAINRDFSKEGDEAGVRAKEGLAASSRAFERTLSRQNVGLTAEQRKGLARRTDLAKARSSAGAENVTRRGLEKRNINLLANLINIGRGIATSATSGLNTAAGLAQSRKLANDAASTAATNQIIGGIGTIAAFLI